MGKILFLILLVLHGFIHLMGFVKAFNFAAIKELTLYISKPIGIIWLLTFLFFIVAAIQLLSENELWWGAAFIGLLVSQTLIILYWQDAKFGTIPNVIILIAVLISYTNFSFNKSVGREITAMLSDMKKETPGLVTEENITHLPAPVQRWMLNNGIIGNQYISSVRVKQQGLMKTSPEDEEWSKAEAIQFVTINPPAFIWKVDMQMMSFIDVAGRDKYIDGRGEMLIKLFSVFPVVNSSDNEKINAGTLQRFLGEIVWYPSAALSPYIIWEAIDDYSAKATMEYKGTTGSGIFYFDDEGNFKQFSAQRYMGSEDDSTLKEWIIKAIEYKEMDGIKVPVKLEATWRLDEGDWTWLKLEITEIEYN